METTKRPIVRTEIIDPSIENALPENCNLSILFQKDGLVFSILRNDVEKFIVLGEYELPPGNEQTTNNLFSFTDELQGPFGNTQLGFYTSKFTLIPASLFSANDLEKLADFQLSVNDGEVLRYDLIKTHDVVIIYAIPQALMADLENRFEDVAIHHTAYFTISHYLDLYKNKPGEHIHAQLWRQHVEVTVIRNGKLVLCSSFNFEKDEDVLYFILNIYEQLDLNPESVPVKLSGEIVKGTSLWGLLEKYIRYVELEARPSAQYSHEFKSVPEHKYNRLFQAAQCV